jgi:hypothetical protein
MSIYLKLLSRFLQALSVCCLLMSCRIDPILDPYYVSDDRQKENIYYAPPAAYSPLSSEKNHFDFNITHSAGSSLSGYELHSGYIVSKNIGLMATYSQMKNTSGSPSNTSYNRFELGVGYIKPLKNNWHFETYAGMGSGRINNYHHTGYSNVGVTNYFIQPAMALNSRRKTATFGMLSRFSGVNFNVKQKQFDDDREQITAKNLKALEDDPFHILWEPGIVMRAGWKNFKFNGGYTYSVDLTGNDLHRSKGKVTLGVTAELNTRGQN